MMLLAAVVLALQAQAPPPPAKPQEPPVPVRLWQDFCCFEKGRTDREGLVTVVFDLSHTPGAAPNVQGLEEFQRLLSPYLTAGGKGRIDVSNRLSTLTITDTKENIPYVEKMLHLIHSPDQPIMIEAKVVELRWDKDLQIGLQGDLNAVAGIWTQDPGSEGFLQEVRTRLNPQAALGLTPFQGSTFRFSSPSSHRGSIGGVVQMFLERGKAQILSQPRILVRADQTASIFSGDDVPYPASITVGAVTGNVTTFGYKNAGVKLQVTPHVAAPGQVSLKLAPEVTSTFGFVEITPGTQAPQFTVRKVDTELLVRDGQEVVIGGLYRRDKGTIRRGLPFLMDIPVFGYLFGKIEETELIQEVLFFIKPTVIKSEREMPRGGFVPDK